MKKNAIKFNVDFVVMQNIIQNNFAKIIIKMKINSIKSTSQLINLRKQKKSIVNSFIIHLTKSFFLKNKIINQETRRHSI